MPRKMGVVNGPNFRHLAFSTPVFNETGFDSTFTMDSPRPKGVISINKDPRIFQLQVEFIGRARRNSDQNLFVLIANHRGGMKDKTTWWHYVIHYNTKTRKGHCFEYTDDEFFSDNVICKMFQIS